MGLTLMHSLGSTPCEGALHASKKMPSVHAVGPAVCIAQSFDAALHLVYASTGALSLWYCQQLYNPAAAAQ